MALYRTYRPAKLDDVVGQDHVTGPLRRALENDRVHHAYLFSGPRGCGKTSTARILARSLNCEQGPTPDPCGVCQSCTDLAANGPGSLDVIELDAASHGGVEDTRDLRERAMFAPASSRYKVYIIDEAHMVTTAGFNALLKLVEEPPEHVRFVFATTEAEKVLPTIRSRTHNYTFRLVPSKTLQQHLAYVCEEEGVAAEPAALALVARAGAGSVRDSLSVLGQVISGSGPDGVTYAEAVASSGMTDATLLDATVDALAAHDGAGLFTVIDQVIDAGHDPRRFVTDLLERFRDLIVLHNVPNAVELGLIDAPEDQVAREIEQAQPASARPSSRARPTSRARPSASCGGPPRRGSTSSSWSRACCCRPRTPTRPRTRARLDQLERRMAGRDPCTPPPPRQSPPSAARRPRLRPTAPAGDDAARRTGAAEAAVRGAPTTAAPAPLRRPPRSKPPARPHGARRRRAPAAAAAPAPASPSRPRRPPTRGVGLDQFVSMWPAVLDAVKSYSRVAWMTFDGSRPVSLANGVLAVGVETIGKVNSLKASGHDERLRQAILDVMKTDVRIDVILAPGGGASAPGAATGRRPPSAAGRVRSTSAPEPDAPSLDDANADGAVGVDLALRELGATQIGEIEH